MAHRFQFAISAPVLHFFPHSCRFSISHLLCVHFPGSSSPYHRQIALSNCISNGKYVLLAYVKLHSLLNIHDFLFGIFQFEIVIADFFPSISCTFVVVVVSCCYFHLCSLNIQRNDSFWNWRWVQSNSYKSLPSQCLLFIFTSFSRFLPSFRQFFHLIPLLSHLSPPPPLYLFLTNFFSALFSLCYSMRQ